MKIFINVTYIFIKTYYGEIFNYQANPQLNLFYHHRRFDSQCLRYTPLIRKHGLLSEENVESPPQIQKHMNAEFAIEHSQNSIIYLYTRGYIKMKMKIHSMDFIHATFAAKFLEEQKV